MNVRFARSIMSLMAAFAIAAVGCSKDKKSTAVAEPEAAAPPAPLYAAFPSATNVVVGFDVQAILASPLGSKLKTALSTQEKLAEANEACGFDLLSKLGAVTVGVDMESPDEVLVVARGFSAADIQACAAGMTAKGKTATYQEQGQFAEVALGDAAADSTWIYWVDSNTMLFGEPTSGTEAKGWLEAKVATPQKLADSQPFQAVVANVDTQANVWVAAFAEAKPIDIAGEVQNVRGTVDVSDGVAVDFALRYPSPEVASAAATKIDGIKQMMSGQPGVGPMLAKLSVKASGPEIAIQGAWTAAEVDTLTQMLMMGFAQKPAPAPAAAPTMAPEAGQPAAESKTDAPAAPKAAAEPKN